MGSIDVKGLGYLKLRKIADSNIESGWGAERVNPCFDWVIERAGHYAEKLDIPVDEILNNWADRCNYSFLNYFQDVNQPKLTASYVSVFDTVEEFRGSVGNGGFRCPSCRGISTNPYECVSKKLVDDGEECDWKVYGFLRDLGKGVYVFIKEEMRGELMFMPIVWEEVSE